MVYFLFQDSDSDIDLDGEEDGDESASDLGTDDGIELAADAERRIKPTSKKMERRNSNNDF